MALESIEVLFDWMQFTIQSSTPEKVCKVLFNCDIIDMLHTPSGRFGYNKTATYGEKIHVMWHDMKADMGIHVLLSGSACRELEDLMTWQVFIDRVLSFEIVKFTRVDVAIDCYQPYFTIDKLYDEIQAGNLVSRFRRATYMEQINLESIAQESASIKFGSMSSDIYIVFYDKLSERKNAGYDVDQSVSFWTRCEIRFKHDLAVQIIKQYCMHDFVFGDYVNGILYNYLDFKDNTGKTRRKREDTAKWWSDFLGDVQKLSIAPSATQSTITSKRKYADMAWSKMAVMLKAVDNDFFDSLLSQGIKKIKQADVEIINAHLIANNIAPLSLQDLMEIIHRSDEHYDVRYNEQLRMDGI